MQLYLLSFALQILFAVHAWRTGRDQFWIFILLIFPGVGCALYFFAEILPEMLKGPEADRIKAWWAHRKDPDKDAREAWDALDAAPTVANRLRLAQVLMRRGDYDGVIVALQPALDGHFADDPAVLEGLAFAYQGKGALAPALDYAERACTHEAWVAKDYMQLLRARLTRANGMTDKAKALYAALVKHYPGEEARMDYAGLLAETGDAAGAQAIYADIVRRAPYAPPHYQDAQKEWIDAAQRALKNQAERRAGRP